MRDFPMTQFLMICLRVRGSLFSQHQPKLHSKRQGHQTVCLNFILSVVCFDMRVRYTVFLLQIMGFTSRNSVGFKQLGGKLAHLFSSRFSRSPWSLLHLCEGRRPLLRFYRSRVARAISPPEQMRKGRNDFKVFALNNFVMLSSAK